MPTAQYAYIEAEIESESPVSAIMLHNEIEKLYRSNDSKAEFNRSAWRDTVDRFITSGSISSEDYELLTDKERFVLNEIKKAIKRVNKLDI